MGYTIHPRTKSPCLQGFAVRPIRAYRCVYGRVHGAPLYTLVVESVPHKVYFEANFLLIDETRMWVETIDDLSDDFLDGLKDVAPNGGDGQSGDDVPLDAKGEPLLRDLRHEDVSANKS